MKLIEATRDESRWAKRFEALGGIGLDCMVSCCDVERSPQSMVNGMTSPSVVIHQHFAFNTNHKSHIPSKLKSHNQTYCAYTFEKEAVAAIARLP
jgi:hypothetical protein